MVFRNIWWIAAGLVVLSEVFVFWQLAPEEKSWSDQPLLQLDTEKLSSPHPVAFDRPEGKSDPAEPVPYEFREIPEGLTGAVEQLSFARGLYGVYTSSGESYESTTALELFYFEYEAGNPRFIDDVFGHAPEVCMSAMGAVLQEAYPSRNIRVGEFSIPVRVLEFSSPLTDRPLWIFKLTWVPEEAPIKPGDTASSLRREKVLAGIFRNSRPPARVILAGGRNFQSLDEAWTVFEELVVSNLYFHEPQPSE